MAVASACSKARAPEPAPAAATDVAAWQRELASHREKTDQEFKSAATSPLAAIERHTPKTATYLAVRGDKLAVDASAEGASFVLRPATADGWTWERIAPGAIATSADGARTLEPGPLAEPTQFQVGRFRVMAQTAAATFVVTGYDPETEARRTFEHLAYFAPAPQLAVTARLTPSTDTQVLDIPTSIGLTKPYRRVGTLELTLDGKPHKLTAFRPAGATSGALFVPFRDATSGKTSYGAGRFLDVAEPAAGASTVTVDFNRAYNPYCAYSPAYNCPLPPPENHLTVAIEAGEQTFSGPHS